MQISQTHTSVTSHSLRRYAFRSLEKAALQEIGPRFTLKLRWIKKGVPAMRNLGAPPPPLVLASDVPEGEETTAQTESGQPPKGDEYLWQWKVLIAFIYLPLLYSHLNSMAARVGGFTTNFFLVRPGCGGHTCTVGRHEWRLCYTTLFNYSWGCRVRFRLGLEMTIRVSQSWSFVQHSRHMNLGVPVVCTSSLLNSLYFRRKRPVLENLRWLTIHVAFAYQNLMRLSC